MGRIDRLADRYKSYIALPWQKDLAGAALPGRAHIPALGNSRSGFQPL